MVKRLSFLMLCVLTVGLVIPASQTRATGADTDDIDKGDTTFWGDQTKSSPHPLAFAMSADGKTITLLSVRRMGATTALTKANHVDDGTKKFSHYHCWDPSGKGSDTYSDKNRDLADNFWNAVFGVGSLTGDGKLDDDAVTKVAAADMYKDCTAYALSSATVTGSWEFALADDNAWSAVTTKVDKTKGVKAKDMIFYSKGTGGGFFNLHMTLVETVDSDKPKNLMWKYGPSGVYRLVRSKNFYDTPAYIPSGTTSPTWELKVGGAGDSDSILDIYRKK